MEWGKGDRATFLAWQVPTELLRQEPYNNEVTNMTNIQSSKEAAFRKNKEAFGVNYA